MNIPTKFNASLALIVANCAVFFLSVSFPALNDYLSLCPFSVLYKYHFWSFATYMFAHGSLMHLLSNMLGLFFFGLMVERALGSKEFLCLYFVCGVASGALSFLYFLAKHQYFVFLLGASGALYSVLFAYAVIYPRANVYILGLIPIPSPLLVIIYAAIEIFSQFGGVMSNVAHYTHLFGFLAAFLYFVLKLHINPIKVWRDAYKW